ncbi:hypothetical protein [Sulfurimonas sp.]|uniref:hypothetical protein n=1 Tax=Sulfurimonas sp. TaxID=2022749 RepID=UPI002AB07832|nr:hypothetical protein [Sulfurimonas sp.]
MKITKILLLLITLLLVSACGNKTPFKEQKVLEKAALVYIYANVEIRSDDGSSDPEYSIRINNKPYMQRLKEGEYIVLNLKPQAMTISATKKQISEKVLKMNFKEGKTYYLKISSSEDGIVNFEQINNSIGSKEITKTGLAGSSEESSENIITEFVNPKEKESMEVKAAVAPAVVPVTTPQKVTLPPAVSSPQVSKTDEIMKAFEMKEKGIVTDEEFKALKINILNK